MNTIKLEMPAKINLTLDVLKKREDGYHDVKMIMQTVSLFDTVTVSKKEDGITLKTNFSFLPRDNRNIAFSAAELFFNTLKLKGGCDIDIFKRIPVAAGLAGGSSNAAGVLKALNLLYDTRLNTKELMQMGKMLGADVPYCIIGKTALSEGIGDILTPLEPIPDCFIILCKPPVSISTKSIYSRINCSKINRRPDTDGCLEAIKNHNIYELSRRMYNVMQEIAEEDEKSISYIIKDLIDLDAIGAVMSGSGPSVFGIFDDLSKAEYAHKKLKGEFSDTFLVKPV